MGQYFIPISNLVAHCREPENISDALILPKLVGEYLNLPHIDWSVGWKPNYVTLNNPESYEFYKNFIRSETIK